MKKLNLVLMSLLLLLFINGCFESNGKNAPPLQLNQEVVQPLQNKVELVINNKKDIYRQGDVVSFAAIVRRSDGTIVEDSVPEVYKDEEKIQDNFYTIKADGVTLYFNAKYNGIQSETQKIKVKAEPCYVTITSDKNTNIEVDGIIKISGKVYDKNWNELTDAKTDIYVNGNLVATNDYIVKKVEKIILEAKYEKVSSAKIEIMPVVPPPRIITVKDIITTDIEGTFIDVEIDAAGFNLKGYGVEVAVSYDTAYFDYDDIADGGKHKAYFVSSAPEGKQWGMKVIKEDIKGKVIVAAMGLDTGTSISGTIIKVPLKLKNKKGKTEIYLEKANILSVDLRSYMSSVNYTDKGIIEIN